MKKKIEILFHLKRRSNVPFDQRIDISHCKTALQFEKKVKKKQTFVSFDYFFYKI